MAERQQLLTSIAASMADYRTGEVRKPDAAHVGKWINQFDYAVQLPMLREMDHVLKKTYFTRQNFVTFLTGLLKSKKFAGENPCEFWKNVGFLDIQHGGASQADMLKFFDELLKEECGLSIADCGKDAQTYVYLDDATFTGNRVLKDLSRWISEMAPQKAFVHIVTIALHTQGQGYANGKLRNAIKAAGKSIDIKWWRQLELEDRKDQTDKSDVLRPCSIPADADVGAYVAAMTHKPHLRNPGNVGGLGVFSSEEGRALLEQQFLMTGVKIRKMCPNLHLVQRPLGHSALETLGFGSTVVTFRNCPNNAPLALWVDAPWYPLFTRSTNTDAAIKKAFASFK